MTLYVDGLSKPIRTVVARYRESVPRREMTFADLIHFAPSEDKAFRALARQSRSYSNNSTPPRGSQPYTLSRPQARSYSRLVNVLEENGSASQDDNDSTSNIYSNDRNQQHTDIDEDDDVFYVNN